MESIKDLLKENFELILDKQRDIIILSDFKNKKILYANKELERFFGVSFEEFFEKNKCMCNTFIKKEGYLFSTMENGIYWIEYIQHNPHKSHRALICDKDGFYHHFNVYIKKITEEIFMVVFNNISSIISIQEDLMTEKVFLKEYKKIVDISTILTKTDIKGVITYANDKFCEISKYKREELIGKQHNIIRHPDTPKELFKNLWSTIKNGGIWSGSLKNKAKDGTTYYVHATIAPIIDKDGNIKEFIGIRRDITDEYLLREELEEKNRKIEIQNTELRKKALIDSLTDTYNRRGLDELLKEMITNYIKDKKTDISIIMTDIDLFKVINDTYGHDVGDRILSEYVGVLKENIKKRDIIARYGGEEFIIILPNTNKNSAKKLAESLRKTVEEKLFYNGIKLTSSFGISSLEEIKEFNNIDECINSLTKIADNRLYESKKQGRNKVVSE